MTEEELRLMQEMQQTQEMKNMDASQFQDPSEYRQQNRAYDMALRGQIPLERLVETAKLQYDMLVQLGLIDPEITPFDAMKVLSGNQNTGVPGINIPAIADETIPMDLNMQLDPTVRSVGPSPEELMAEEQRKREMMLRFQGQGLLQ
tara:strand:- start:37 stop:477 length:441 start_codon:yes stop_codon:yes gene_type:complete